MLFFALILFFGLAVFFNTLFVIVYNHLLSMMHESVIKKVVALVGLPTGTIAAFLLTIFWMNFEMSIISNGLIYVGGLVGWIIFLNRIMVRLNQKKEDWFRGNTEENIFEKPVDYSSISPLYFPILKLLEPINCVGKLQIHECELKLEDLPAEFEDYRILHMTDFHLHHTLRMEWFEFVIDQIKELKPDLILFGGDMISKYKHVDHVAYYLKKISAPDGVYFVRGNHDFWKAPHRLKRHAESAGYKLLSNDTASIKRNDATLNLIGLESPYIPLVESETKKLSSVPNPKIALVHTPESYHDTAELGADIALAGHTHGGQVRLPFFGTTICGCGVTHSYADGRSHIGEMKTWTSRGVGAFFPFRFRCKPELIVLNLKKKESS